MKTHFFFLFMFVCSLGTTQLNSVTIPIYTAEWLLNDNTIWQLTNAGIYIRDENTLKVLEHFYITNSEERYTDIKKDRFNNIWVGLAEGGIAKFDGKNWTIWDFHNTPLFRQTQGIQNIGIEADGTVWVVAHSGSSADTMRIYTFKNNVWSLDSFNQLLNNDRYPEFLIGPNDEFIAVSLDTILVKENNQWIGVPEYDNKMYRYYEDPVIDSKGRLWVRTVEDKIFMYNSLKEKPTLVAQSSNRIYFMVLDNNDNPWITSDADAISLWKDNRWRTIPSYAGSTIQGMPFHLLKGNDNKMYVEQSFYYYYDMEVTKFENETAVSNHYIDYTLSEELGIDGKGNLWFGGSANFLVRKDVVDGHFDYFELFQFPVADFQRENKTLVTGNGEEMFYILVSGKIIHFDGNSWKEIKRNGSSWKAIDVSVSEDNKLYIVVEKGPNNWSHDIFVYDLLSDTYNQIDLSLFGELYIYGIERGINNTQWFISEESLGKINPDGTVDLYSIPDNQTTYYDVNFSINNLGTIQITTSDRWIFNLQTIYHFNPGKESWTRIEIPDLFFTKINFDLSIYGPYAILDNKNRIWLAGVNDRNTQHSQLIVWNYDGSNWNEVYGQAIGQLNYVRGILETKEGRIVIVGQNEFVSFDPGASVYGQTLNDSNLNCIQDSSDGLFPNIAISTTNEAGQKRIHYSNQNGLYNLYHPVGKVLIKAISPNPFWESCNPNEVELQLTKDSSAKLDFLMDQIYNCPFVDVQVTSGILRLCRVTTLYIKATNNGTESTDSASVTITLPPEFSFHSASMNYKDLGNQQYQFFIGHLGVFQSRDFTMDVEVSCKAVIGQSICIEVNSYPNEFCNADPIWSGADIRLSASCVNDHAEFELWNRGQSKSTSPLQYTIYKNDVQGQQVSYALDQGEKLKITMPAEDATYRLISNQEINHPAEKQGLSLAVETCNSNSPIRTRFVDTRKNFTGSPYDLVFCFPVIGSYDPNDKAAYPVGVGEKTHFIEHDEELEYTIRFQNTGNDTAFEIVILDTLDRNLDVEKFTLLQSSHPVQVEIKNNLLSFKFSNIYLPDSNINNTASNGFVKYRISPKDNAPYGSYISNKADIYFDFNAPVVTNEVWHIIYPEVHTTGTKEERRREVKNQLVVYPNPTSSKITIDTKQFNDFTLRVFDLNGRLLELKSILGKKDLVEMSLQKYSSGVYFINITNKEGKHFYGKVFKQ
jgi:uncharacterized repeat protein (TIGR01451 family)